MTAPALQLAQNPLPPLLAPLTGNDAITATADGEPEGVQVDTSITVHCSSDYVSQQLPTYAAGGDIYGAVYDTQFYNKEVGSTLVANMTSYEATGDYEFTIHLAAPNVNFASELSFFQTGIFDTSLYEELGYVVEAANMVSPAFGAIDVESQADTLVELCQLLDENYLYICGIDSDRWYTFSDRLGNTTYNYAYYTWQVWDFYMLDT